MNELVQAANEYLAIMGKDPHNDTQLYYRNRLEVALNAVGRSDAQVEDPQAPVGEQGVGTEGNEPAPSGSDNAIGEEKGAAGEPGVSTENHQ